MCGWDADTIKVKMQTFPHLYPNLTVCFSTTLKKEGVIRGKVEAAYILYTGTWALITSRYRTCTT